MRKFITTLVVTMLATHLLASPLIVLSISALSDGSLQIIASGLANLPLYHEDCVLQSTTNFVNWTSLSTNSGPFSLQGTVFNIGQPTNSMTFYRTYEVFYH
jgi:hypothetical protein